MEPQDLLDPKQLAEIEEKIKETKDKVEKMVRDYPLTSVAIALGVGYILARLLHGRGRS